MPDPGVVAYLRDLNREIGTRHDALLAERDALAEALRQIATGKCRVTGSAVRIACADAGCWPCVARARLLSVEDNE